MKIYDVKLFDNGEFAVEDKNAETMFSKDIMYITREKLAGITKRCIFENVKITKEYLVNFKIKQLSQQISDLKKNIIMYEKAKLSIIHPDKITWVLEADINASGLGVEYDEDDIDKAIGHYNQWQEDNDVFNVVMYKSVNGTNVSAYKDGMFKTWDEIIKENEEKEN